MISLLVSSNMADFFTVAIIVGVFIFGYQQFADHPDRMAIKVRRDGKRVFERVPAEPETVFPLWIKITIFILISGVLFIPLDFILKRF